MPLSQPVCQDPHHQEAVSVEARQESAQASLPCWTHVIVPIYPLFVSNAALPFGDSFDPTAVGLETIIYLVRALDVAPILPASHHLIRSFAWASQALVGAVLRHSTCVLWEIISPIQWTVHHLHQVSHLDLWYQIAGLAMQTTHLVVWVWQGWMLEKARTLQTSYDVKNSKIHFFWLSLEEQRASGREKKVWCCRNIMLGWKPRSFKSCISALLLPCSSIYMIWQTMIVK